MKKFLFILGIATSFVLCSCTEQTRARSWGGTATVHLEKGQKLMEVTWKEGNSLWYLTEPMEADYTPKTKTFKEDSNFGVVEGKVIFIESR